MIEKIKIIRKALESCQLISNGYESSFDEEKVESALILLDEIIATLEPEDLVTPVGLAEELSFHFSEDQASAIAEHVYQPLLTAVNSIKKFKERS